MPKNVYLEQKSELFWPCTICKGMQPHTKKIAAIQEMEPPRNKQALETLLGMVNYLAKFTLNLAETTAPMRSLLKKDSEFVWDCAQQTAFDKMKLLITSAGTLAYYDVKKEVTLEVDASKHGLGAVLMQERKPVAYASKSLSPTEQEYAQIEKEINTFTAEMLQSPQITNPLRQF